MKYIKLTTRIFCTRKLGIQTALAVRGVTFLRTAANGKIANGEGYLDLLTKI